MEVENNDTNFDRLVAENRHKDILKAFNAMTEELRKTPSENPIVKTLEAHIQSVNGLVKALVNMPKPGAPEVNVDLNNDGIVSSIQDIASKIEQQLEAMRKCIENKPVDMNFTVVRNPAGFITNVIVKSV